MGFYLLKSTMMKKYLMASTSKLPCNSTLLLSEMLTTLVAVLVHELEHILQALEQANSHHTVKYHQVMFRYL